MGHTWQRSCKKMSEQNIIGKGTWIDKLAFELVEREKQLGRNTSLI